MRGLVSFFRSRPYLLLFVILVISAFVRMYGVNSSMMFIGDQAWFYLSAKNLLVDGEIPLVGIPSSHPWIHQGPLWTYTLAVALFISGFNPLSGAYLVAVIGVLTVFTAYMFGKEFFSVRIGLLYALVMSVSPLVVFHSRMAYHTAPIPLAVILFMYVLIKWIKGNRYYFPLVIFMIGILYNLELATVVFIPVVMAAMAYGVYRKKKFAHEVLRSKIIFLAVGGFVVSMLPILLHDIQHGFPQTLKFVVWFGYKILQVLGFFGKSASEHTVMETAGFFLKKYSELLFPPSLWIGLVIFWVVTIVSLLALRKKSKLSPFAIVFFTTYIGVLAYFISNVPSEAYLVMLFPGLIFLFVHAFNKLPYSGLVATSTFFSFTFVYVLFATNFLLRDSVTLQDKLMAVDRIIPQVENNSYSVGYHGPGEEFISSRMPYEYLLWWRTRGQGVENGDRVNISVYETPNDVMVVIEDK